MTDDLRRKLGASTFSGAVFGGWLRGGATVVCAVAGAPGSADGAASRRDRGAARRISVRPCSQLRARWARACLRTSPVHVADAEFLSRGCAPEHGGGTRAHGGLSR